jgi:nitrous oxide reductase accessory protein NosL
MILHIIDNLINETVAIREKEPVVTTPRYMPAPNKFGSYVLGPAVLGGYGASLGHVFGDGDVATTIAGGLGGAVLGAGLGAAAQYVSKAKGYKTKWFKNIAEYKPRGDAE